MIIIGVISVLSIVVDLFMLIACLNSGENFTLAMPFVSSLFVSIALLIIVCKAMDLDKRLDNKNDEVDALNLRIDELQKRLGLEDIKDDTNI